MIFNDPIKLAFERFRRLPVLNGLASEHHRRGPRPLYCYPELDLLPLRNSPLLLRLSINFVAPIPQVSPVTPFAFLTPIRNGISSFYAHLFFFKQQVKLSWYLSQPKFLFFPLSSLSRSVLPWSVPMTTSLRPDHAVL